MTMTGNADTDARLITELSGLRTDIQSHAKADADAIGGIHTRLDTIASEQAKLASAVADASSIATLAKSIGEFAQAQAQRIEAAHAVDIAARAGAGDAIQRRLAREALDSLSDDREVATVGAKADAKAKPQVALQIAKVIAAVVLTVLSTLGAREVVVSGANQAPPQVSK